jgi:hypothetical protein
MPETEAFTRSIEPTEIGKDETIEAKISTTAEFNAKMFRYHISICYL